LKSENSIGFPGKRLPANRWEYRQSTSPVPDRRFQKAITITRSWASTPLYRRIFYTLYRKKSLMFELCSSFTNICKVEKLGFCAVFRARWFLTFKNGIILPISNLSSIWIHNAGLVKIAVTIVLEFS